MTQGDTKWKAVKIVEREKNVVKIYKPKKFNKPVKEPREKEPRKRATFLSEKK